MGWALDDPSPQSAHHNSVYKLLTSDCVDGIIVLSPGLACATGQAAIERLCESYRPLPLCSLGMTIPGVPSIFIDNRAGMRSVIEHAIVKHHSRRVAFLGGTPGNADAEMRLDEFQAVLKEYGLPIDPGLITTGHFDMSRAESATADLLDSQKSFDTLVAANDGMAIGALRILKHRGIRVPQDIRVVGFDDVALSRFIEPALTTVRQPLDKMAAKAVELIADQFSGRQVPDRVDIHAELVVRHSCGCTQLLAPAGSQHSATTKASLADPVGDANATIEQQLIDPVRRDTIDAFTTEYRLTNALTNELNGHKGAVLSTVDSILEEMDIRDNPCDTLLPLVLDLRSHAQPSLSKEFENVWSATQRTISGALARSQLEQRFQVETMYNTLLDAANHILTALDVRSLRDGLLQALTGIHTKDLMISLFPEDSRQELETLVCFREGKACTRPVERVRATDLFPSHFRDSERQRTLFVLPMVSVVRMIGIFVIEAHDEFFDYQMLRDHIATSFKLAALHEQAINQTALHERGLQERVATAERMRSLSVLAGGVAHDLNNALGSLVALSDVVLEELDMVRQDPHHDETELRADLVAMKTGALRAAETIKDLMTLGRRGRAAREPLDVNQVVQCCIRDVRSQLPADRIRSIHVVADSTGEPLTILGSEPHLIRAIGNLVRNAIEVIDQGGTVIVRTDCVKLDNLLCAYEDVPPGQYATVTVRDTGCGIPTEQLNRVFEPFFSTKKLSEVSGSGLGLAIVHSVVKEHDGFLDVRSQLGQGTTFTLYFPRTNGAIITGDEPNSVQHGHAQILVVNDDPIQLRIARRVLSRLGYDITTLASGAHAYQLLCHGHLPVPGAGAKVDTLTSAFDVLIMDMALNEEKTGLEVFQDIRRVFPRQKCIIASGHSVMSDIHDIPRTELLWLSKPYTMTTLAQAVQSLLGAEKRISSRPPLQG